MLEQLTRLAGLSWEMARQLQALVEEPDPSSQDAWEQRILKLDALLVQSEVMFRGLDLVLQQTVQEALRRNPRLPSRGGLEGAV